jgi:hypothetical protein
MHPQSMHPQSKPPPTRLRPNQTCRPLLSPKWSPLWPLRLIPIQSIQLRLHHPRSHQLR